MRIVPWIGLLLVACSGEDAPAPVGGVSEPKGEAPWFVEVAAERGLDFRHHVAKERHFYMPETVTGGVCVIDYDLDGDLDVYLVQGGDLDDPSSLDVRNRLFRNDGSANFEDVTDEAGVGHGGYGIGCAVGDYDGDGDPDLYVTNVGANVLYRNEGDGTFRDVTQEAGVGDTGHGSSCAFGDIDADGDLDLFVANYVVWSKDNELECATGSGEPDYCSPKNYNAPAPDVLYRNDGGGSFTDVSESSGIRAIFGNGLGVVFGDFDGNGLDDVYVANDGNPNHLWINQGEGRFEDEAQSWGCSANINGTVEAGMGVSVTDCDQDGDPDLFMTHLRAETNTYYENRGGYFKDVTALSGLAASSRDFTGFGLGFHDFDHDGVLDLFVANGRVSHNARVLLASDRYAEPNQVFRGRPGPRFDEVFPRGGTAEPHLRSSRGAAFGDLDGDGDVDVVVNNNHGTASLLINRAGDRGGAWVRFHVVDGEGRDAIGAGVRLGEGDEARHARVRRAYSYCASNEVVVHFGLGERTSIPTVVVTWPGGETEAFGPFEARATHRLQRGTGR